MKTILKTSLLLVGFVVLALYGATLYNGSMVIVGTINYCEDAEMSDAYACDLDPALPALNTGTEYSFKANTANTGAATLDLNSIGAEAIKKLNGNITTDLETGDICAGQIVTVKWDGTNFQMVSPVCTPPSGGSGTDLLDLTTRTIRDDFCLQDTHVGTNSMGLYFQQSAGGSGAADVGMATSGTRRCGLRLSTSTGGSDLVRVYGNNSLMAVNPSTETFDQRWRVQGISATTDVFISAGFTRLSSSDEVCNDGVVGDTSCVAFVFKPATSGNWYLVTCASSTCTHSDSGVAVATSTTYLLRIWSTSAGTIRWSINGTEETPVTTNIPNLVIAPGIHLYNTTTTARQYDLTGFVQESAAQ